MITFSYTNYIKKSINKFLKNKGFSENNIYYLIKNKNVLVNGKEVLDKNHIVNFHDKILVRLNNEENNIKPLDQNLNIVYEDEYLLIVNKPYNLDIEPTIKNNENTLSNIISYYYQKNNINSKIHLVNRLDKLTSGLVILAKNQYIHNLFSKVKIIKKYKALLHGKTNKKGVIKIKIHKLENSIKRVVDEKGKLSITKYKRLAFKNNQSLVDINLITGRTHQIRLSFAYINHPLENDPLYGDANSNEYMYLNAYYLKFTHPIKKKTIKIIL